MIPRMSVLGLRQHVNLYNIYSEFGVHLRNKMIKRRVKKKIRNAHAEPSAPTMPGLLILSMTSWRQVKSFRGGPESQEYS